MIGRIQLFSSYHDKKEGGTSSYILISPHAPFLIFRMLERFPTDKSYEVSQKYGI